MLVVIGAAILLLAGLAGLELYVRLRPRGLVRMDRASRTPWQELAGAPGERRWRCRFHLVNDAGGGDLYLPDLRAGVRWLTRQPYAPAALTGTAVLFVHDGEGRRDGYVVCPVVHPGEPLAVEVDVIARGTAADLEHLAAGVVRIEYACYTRTGLVPMAAELILPVAQPAEQPAPRERDGMHLYPLRTHLLTDLDDPVEVVARYTRGVARPGDVMTIAESALAIMQGRYRLPEEVRPGFWARRLCHFFPLHGSLGTPYSLQALMDEEGTLRVMAAAAVGLAAKLLGWRGVFYRLAGAQARLIDDVGGTLAPYDRYIVLGPKDPQAFVAAAAARTGLRWAVVDANDAGQAYILAASPGIDVPALERLLRANPAGNGAEQTPLVLIRPASSAGSCSEVA